MASVLSVTKCMQLVGSRAVFFGSTFSVDFTHKLQNCWRNRHSNFDAHEQINHTNPLKSANIATIKQSMTKPLSYLLSGILYRQNSN